jgi:hypothetical protein
MLLLENVYGFSLRVCKNLSMEIIMQSLMTGESPVRRQSCAIALAAAAAAFAFTSPAHADFIAGCTGTTTLVCTFTAINGQVFVDSQAADINVTGTNVAATETFTFNSITHPNTDSHITIDQTSPPNVDSIGHFTLTDDLLTDPPRADTITITITGTNLALVPNEKGNIFGAHVCTTVDGVCPTNGNTFFTTPVPAPIVGVGLPGLVAACGGLIALARRRRRQLAD